VPQALVSCAPVLPAHQYVGGFRKIGEVIAQESGYSGYMKETTVYPDQYEISRRFKDGSLIHFRPIRPTDAALLLELFHSHSEQTIIHRYFVPLHELPQEMLDKFVSVDYRNDMAIIGLIPFESRERMICVGRYFRTPGTTEAEIAVTVHDDFQRRGIGTFLVKYLAGIARRQGLSAFTAEVLADNHAMLRVFHKVFKTVESDIENGESHLHLSLNFTNVRPVSHVATASIRKEQQRRNI
jgi:acetyltransferase